MTPSCPPGTPPRQLAIEHPVTDDSTKKRQWCKLLEPQKWKVDLYDMSLVLLPTLMPIYMTLRHETLNMDISEACAHLWLFKKDCWANDPFRALLFAFLIYVVLALIIAFFQAAAYKEVKGRDMPKCKAVAKGLVFFPIGVLSFLPELPNLSDIRGLLISLGVALCSSVILKREFSLPEEYRVAAKSAPPLSRECWIRQYALCNFVLASLFAFSIILYHLWR